MKTIQYVGSNDKVNRRPVRVKDEEAAWLVNNAGYRYVPKSLRRFFLRAPSIEASEVERKKRVRTKRKA